MCLAHISEDERRQTVAEHAQGTAERAEKFAARFGSGEFGRCCGMLHDAGKYSEAFQRHICENGPKTDHSTAGAIAIQKATPSGMGLMAAYCIAGHHAGLPDGGKKTDTPDEPTLFARLKRKVPEFSDFYKETDVPSLLPKSIPPIQMLGKKGFSASFFIRMLFSCLVDADFLDTEAFMSDGAVARGGGESIPALYEKLEEHLKQFKNPSNELNAKRNEIRNACLRKAPGSKGLYTLTVPTGGGKTLSSLAFALRHAAEHKMERVIYAIPYTSIIEQNAAVFRDILGDENVLEHHCNFEYDDDDQKNPKRLAAENWDSPLIVTTNVQLFESLFANKPSRCRKLHNIANSVIIFDEAQMIPRDYLQPCIRAISELVLNYGCTAVLCSATQPELQSLFPPEIKSTEISENIPELYRFFRRTGFVQAGELNDETLADRLNAEKQVLCIVNTRKHAQVIHSMLKKNGSYHLSTFMYPAHRKKVLDEIRTRLKNGEDCRVVSTSLIESGVDVDFPTVYRETAGLDSEIQAAGRCNREGKRPADESMVVIYQPEEKYRRNLHSNIQKPADVTNIVLTKYNDISSPEAIRCYFETLYHVSANLDAKGIVDRFEEGAADNFSFPFAGVAADFQLIESDTQAVLIPKGSEAAELERRFRAGERSRELFRKSGQYCVNLYSQLFKSLYNAGKLELLDGIAILTDLEVYSDKIGLIISESSGTAYLV